MLSYGICGSIDSGTAELLRPSTYLRNLRLQELLLDLNARHRSWGRLADDYSDLSEQVAGMPRLGMLRDESEQAPRAAVHTAGIRQATENHSVSACCFQSLFCLQNGQVPGRCWLNRL
jgi:hypothetical protein